MKKKITTLVMCFISLSTFAQIEIDSANFAPNKDYYILPSSFRGDNPCASLVPFTSFGLHEYTSPYSGNPYLALDTNIVRFSEHTVILKADNYFTPISMGGFEAVAQPYSTDTAVVIRGIASYSLHLGRIENYSDLGPLSVAIIDTNSQVLASITLNTEDEIENFSLDDDHIPNYTEIFFDEPITVTGNYYAYASINSLGILDRNCSSGTRVRMVYWYHQAGTCIFQDITNSFYATNFEEDYETRDFDNIMDLYVFPIYQPTNSGLDDVLMPTVSFYPNPVKDVLNVSVSGDIDFIEIYNSLGQELKRVEVRGRNAQIDISSFDRGIYFAKIFCDNGVSSKKFVVE